MDHDDSPEPGPAADLEAAGSASAGAGAGAGGRKSIHVDLVRPQPPGTTIDGVPVVGPDWLAEALLFGHLRTAGLPASMNDTEVTLGFGGTSCRVRVDDGWTGPGPQISLWFDISLPDHALTIVESLAGPGPSPLETVQAAVHQFLRGTVGPLRRLYGVPGPDDGVTIGTIESQANGVSADWEVLLGPPLVWGAEPDLERAAEAAIAERAYMVDVLDAVTGLLVDRRVHWCKAFLARMGDGTVRGQVTLDNIGSAAAFDALMRRQLPGSGQILTRQFALIRPVAGPSNERQQVRRGWFGRRRPDS